ncbi:MAG: PLP-dependent aspartate aminotransferase family protein [Spirochaetaceae bacterium]|jgi:cystathionine beta-lyase/cystathionine gamma-synthase|nr:PLP-dependent aspartate aminotransferase family protein [Spirochaetaceae bacterium]
MKKGTLLIHNGHDYDPGTGALGVPIIQTSTFAKLSFSEDQEFDYARSGNPTRKALEETIALLEGGEYGYAFSSGMAAAASVLGIFAAGDHIITAADIYGGTYRIFEVFYKRWGLNHTFVDASRMEEIEAALTPQTKAIFVETPSNPLFKITDLKACASFARAHNLITIVDNTFMTPYLQRPLEAGCDIVIHSATKFLGGHSDVISGLAVARNRALGKRIYAVQNSFGAVPGPWDMFLVMRGIKTLKARMEESQKTALKLARWLSSDKRVEAVYYPGLDCFPGKAVHEGQADGPGAVFSFETRTEEAAVKFLSSVQYAAAAVSLGGVETIASYPIRMSHAAVPPLERKKLGITGKLIRISAGLEDCDDLMEDFDKALS